jgi:hypothetical protein
MALHRIGLEVVGGLGKEDVDLGLAPAPLTPDFASAMKWR